MDRYIAAIYRTKDRPLCVAGVFGQKPHLVSDGPTLRSFLRHLPASYDLLTYCGLSREEVVEANATGARAIFSYNHVRVPELDWQETMDFKFDLHLNLPMKMYDMDDVARLWWLWKSGYVPWPTAYDHLLAV